MTFTIFDVGLLVTFLLTVLTMIFGVRNKLLAFVFGSDETNERKDEALTDVSKTMLRVAQLAYPDWLVGFVGFILDLIDLCCSFYCPLLLERIVNEFTTSLSTAKSPEDTAAVFSAKTNSAIAVYICISLLQNVLGYASKKSGQMFGVSIWMRAQVQIHSTLNYEANAMLRNRSRPTIHAGRLLSESIGKRGGILRSA